MTHKSYFTGEEITEDRYKEVARVSDLCVQYGIMTPYDDRSESHYTDEFMSFTEKMAFLPKHDNEKILEDRDRPESESPIERTMEEVMRHLTMYIALRPGYDQYKTWDFHIDEESFDKWYQNVPTETWNDIRDMSRLVGGMFLARYNTQYENDHKILQKMINLGILKRHGELTADFKSDIEEYCKGVSKPISEIDTSPDDHSEMIAIIAGFIGLSTKEFKKIFSSKHRESEARDLEQMAWVAKRCLIVQK